MPKRAEDCEDLREPITTYLTDRCRLGPVTDLWFSRPEVIPEPSDGRDIVIEAGAQAGMTALRLTCQIH